MTIQAPAAATPHGPFKRQSVLATMEERRQPLPGDDYISSPLASLTHAITIRCWPSMLWPWLAQMGAGRAGWYSYDWIDNGRQPSALRLLPELQRVEVGQVFPALPGTTDGFVVLAFERTRALVLGWLTPEGKPLVTWAFVLNSLGGRTTRLVVRARGSAGYRFRGLPSWASKYIARVVHFVMERKQLLEIAKRAEA